MASDWVAAGTLVEGQDIVEFGIAQLPKGSVPNLTLLMLSGCFLEKAGNSARLENLGFGCMG